MSLLVELAPGQVTQPIPYNAGPELLSNTIQLLYGVGTVRVRMDTSPISYYPKVCGTSSSGVHQTYIWFLDHPGPRPPIAVSRLTSATR